MNEESFPRPQVHMMVKVTKSEVWREAETLWWPNQMFQAKTQCFPNPNQVFFYAKPQPG